MRFFNIENQSGQLIILVLPFLLVFFLILSALLAYTGSEILSHRSAVSKEQALHIAEAGGELAIWKLNNQAGYAGETNTSYGNGTFTVTLASISSGTKLVQIDSYIPNNSLPIAHRTIQFTSSTGSTSNITFANAVQSGQGGFDMDNNAQINGNVYSNGPITGSNGAQITGNAVSVSSISNAHILGNSYSHSIDDSVVGGNSSHYDFADTDTAGNVSAHAVRGNQCKIHGTATYNTNSGCTFLGSQATPNSNVPSDPSALPLPIPSSQITAWEQEAATGGTVGSQTIGTASLGPKKINGDLTINGTLTVTGTLWVTGSITINNGATMKLASSYGNLTGVVLAGVNGSPTAGSIVASNNSTIAGSGVEGSYLLLISQMNNTAANAITISNNALSAIIYAGTSNINVSNNAQVREITGYKIHLNNNVILTSTSGVTNANYFSSSSSGWEMVGQTWQLLK